MWSTVLTQTEAELQLPQAQMQSQIQEQEPQTMLAANALKPLCPYYGGKSKRIGKLIAARLPVNHRIYVEPYFGFGGVLMAKKPSEIEVVNDLNDGIVNLLAVVRDAAKCQELVRRLELTPFSRQEWRNCSHSWREEVDPIEKARQVYVTLAQGFNGVLGGNPAWSCGSPRYSASGTPKEKYVSGFYASFERFPLVRERLRNVMIENTDALRVMQRWDSPQTLLYLDPPYPHETRERGSRAAGREKRHGKPRHYIHEMADWQHIELLDWLTSGQCQSMVVLSSYPNELYNERLLAAGWVHEEHKALATSCLQTLANGVKAATGTRIGTDGATTSAVPDIDTNPTVKTTLYSVVAARTEILWINKAAQAALTQKPEPAAAISTQVQMPTPQCAGKGQKGQKEQAASSQLSFEFEF